MGYDLRLPRTKTVHYQISKRCCHHSIIVFCFDSELSTGDETVERENNTMTNEEDDSMLYKSMLNKTLGLPDFNQYSYLFEDENGDDTESLLNTPSTDAEMSSSIAEMNTSVAVELATQIDDPRPAESPSKGALPNQEPHGSGQITRRNQQLQNYWESQQKESQLIEEKLSSIRVRVEQNETEWKKEKSKLLSPQSRIPKPARSSISALDLELEAEREKRMELEVQCSALMRQLQELQKEMDLKTSASLRLETLKQMQTRHAQEIGELHEQAEHAREKHTKEIANLEASLLKCQQYCQDLEGEKADLVATQIELKNEIEQLQRVELQQQDEISTLEEKLREQNANLERAQENYSALEQKIKRQSLDVASLREIVSGKEEDKAIIQAKLATTETEKVRLQEVLALLEDQKLRSELEVKSLKLSLQESQANVNESSAEIETCRRKITEWSEKYEREYNNNVNLQQKLKRFEAIGEGDDILETKRQKKQSENRMESMSQEYSTKTQDLELQIQQLQKNHEAECDKLNAEIDVYCSQGADLKAKYKDMHDENIELRRQLEQLGQGEKKNGKMDYQETGMAESVGNEDSEGHASLNSHAMRKHVSAASGSIGSSSFNTSTQNHVTRIEAEHAQEIQELLHGLGQEQTGAFDWSSQFDSRDTFSTPFKVKSNATDDSVLSPILRSVQSDAASMGSDSVERKIDGLLEEVGLMEQEQEALFGELNRDASNSTNLGPCEESQFIEEVTTLSQSGQSKVLDPQYDHNEKPSNDHLDGTILLLNNLKDLMNGQKDENEKEASVWDQLHALSEMIDDETHLHSGSMNDSRSGKRSNISAMRASIHSKAPRAPVENSAPSNSSILPDDKDDVEPLNQKEEIIWRVLVAELRHRISFLEHDRNEVVRITGEMLERDRDANRLKLQSAISTARREAFEEFQTFLVGNA